MTSQPPPTVLLLDSQPPGSRSSNLLPRFLHGLAGGFYRPILVTFSNHPQCSDLRRSGFRVLRYPTHRIELFPATLGTAISLGILARSSGAHLIHSLGTLAHVHGALAAQLAGGIPELWHLEDPPSCGSHASAPTLSTLDRAALAVPLEGVVGLAPSLSSPFGGALTCPIEPILREGKIRNLLSPPSETEQQEARAQLGISSDDLLITALGRQNQFRGHEKLIRILRPLITETNRPFRLLFLGAVLGGPSGYPQHLLESCRKFGVVEQVCFAGMQPPERIRALVASSLCLAHVGDQPPADLTLETSLALGTPIVSSSGKEPPFLLIHEETGLLVPTTDLDRFQAAFSRLANDPSLRESLAECARTRMALRINRQLGERLESIYNDLLRKPAPSDRILLNENP